MYIANNIGALNIQKHRSNYKVSPPWRETTPGQMFNLLVAELEVI